MVDIRTYYENNDKSRRGIFLNKPEFDALVGELTKNETGRFELTFGSRIIKGWVNSDQYHWNFSLISFYMGEEKEKEFQLSFANCIGLVRLHSAVEKYFNPPQEPSTAKATIPNFFIRKTAEDTWKIIQPLSSQPPPPPAETTKEVEASVESNNEDEHQPIDLTNISTSNCVQTDAKDM